MRKPVGTESVQADVNGRSLLDEIAHEGARLMLVADEWETEYRAFQERTEPPTVTSPMPLKPDPRRQCFWFGPTSSSRCDRNSLRIGEVFDLL
jgi:hypothetical protein